MHALAALGTPNPGSPLDVPITLTLMAIAAVGYLAHCQREHIRRRRRSSGR